MGSQRVGHDWATELNWTEHINNRICVICLPMIVKEGRWVRGKPYWAKEMSTDCKVRIITMHCWVCNINSSAAAAATKSLQSCLTLCDPMDSSPWGSPVRGILQARALEWVAISFSSAWKWKVKVKSLSLVRLLATPWTAAYQAPPFMGFSR